MRRTLTRRHSGGRALPASRTCAAARWPLGAHALDPPRRIGKPPLGRARGGGEHRLPPAQEVAQHRVDQPPGGAALKLRRRAHRAVDHGVSRRSRYAAAGTGPPRAGPRRWVHQRLVGEKLHARAQLAEEAQRAVREFVHQGAIAARLVRAGERGRQRRSRQHPPYRFRCDALRPLHHAGMAAYVAMASKRWMRSAVGGWVLNRPAMPPPVSGLMIIRCAVAGCVSAVSSGSPCA